MTAKVGEIGRRIYYGTNFDMSGATSVTAKIDRADGTSITVSPIVQGVAFGPYLANEYAIYDTVAGDLNSAGNYTTCLTYNDATPKTYISDSDTFLVEEPC